MKENKKYPMLFVLIGMMTLTGLKAQEESPAEENAANQYMNRNSIESLVNAFDSPNRAEWQKPDEVIGLFGNVNDLKIMDLGAGSGYFTLRLAAKGAFVIAADVNEGFQETIREKLEREDLTGLSSMIELRKVPYDSPDLREGEVDGILIVNTWHHIDDRREYMEKALRGVKKGGLIVIVDFKMGVSGGPPDSHKLEMEKALDELEGLDYEKLSVDTDLLERQYIIMLRR